MKKFLIYIIKILLTVMLLMTVLDLIYTYVYTNASPRNKSQFVLKLKNRKIDYIFIGSSRVENDIVTNLIKKQTSKSAINLGLQGAKLDDYYLYLKLLIENKVTCDKLFIQVDYVFNFESTSVNVKSETLPYIRNNEIIKNHQKNDNNFIKNYYIPFYRYAANDYSIGFRNFFTLLINKKSNINFEDGFSPKIDRFNDSKHALPKNIILKNVIFDRINKLCIAKKIKVIYFCAPIYSQVENLDYIDKLKLKIPELKDYSKSVLDKKYFIDWGHLNKDGAELFTQMIINDLMKNEK